jgi:hypothetical protein
MRGILFGEEPGGLNPGPSPKIWEGYFGIKLAEEIRTENQISCDFFVKNFITKD